MAELNDTQFYELQETGEPQKPNRKFLTPKVKKVLLIAGAFAVGAGFIAIVVVMMVNNRQTEKDQIQSIVTEADEGMARDFGDCADEKNVEACRKRVRKDKAREMGEVSVCRGLTDQAYTNCIELIAFDTLSDKACDALENGEVDLCKDHIKLLSAVGTQDYVICESIVDGEKKISCQNQILPYVIESGECEKLGIDAALCETTPLSTIANDGEPIDCEEYTSEEKFVSCMEIFTARDSDGDGLNDWQEDMEIGTDFREQDTDGDGFTDGEEVAAGFDPLN